MPTLDIAPNRRRAVLLLVAVCVLVAAGVTTWRVLASESEPETPAGEVVAEFFLAQEAGDCERLLDVLSEQTWSDDGRRSREEFLELCPDLIAGYEPPTAELWVEYPLDDADEVIVDLWNTYGGEDDGGRLVLEDGEWKVVADDHILRIGPPPDVVVRGYLEAYAAGDCEAIPTYVAEETWSEQGRLSADEFQARCAAAVDARSPSLTAGLDPKAYAETRYDDRTFVAVTGADGSFEVSMVWEDLRWWIEGDEVPGAPPGTYLRNLRIAELAETLPDHPTIGGRTCFHHHTTADDAASDTDLPPPPKNLGTPLTLSRVFSSCYVALTVHEYADAETARRAADRMAALMLDRGYRRVDVPGHRTAIGMVEPGLYASVLLAHDNLVIGTTAKTGSIGEAARLLSAQLRGL